jgi:hypothetical protein
MRVNFSICHGGKPRETNIILLSDDPDSPQTIVSVSCHLHTPLQFETPVLVFEDVSLGNPVVKTVLFTLDPGLDFSQVCFRANEPLEICRYELLSGDGSRGSLDISFLAQEVCEMQCNVQAVRMTEGTDEPEIVGWLDVVARTATTE